MGCRSQPFNGQNGMIRLNTFRPVPSICRVDQDSTSDTNASSVLLLQPGGGFTGRVAEKETLCFYNPHTLDPIHNASDLVLTKNLCGRERKRFQGFFISKMTETIVYLFDSTVTVKYCIIK